MSYTDQKSTIWNGWRSQRKNFKLRLTALSTQTWKFLIRKNKSYEKTVVAPPPSLGSALTSVTVGYWVPTVTVEGTVTRPQVGCRHTWSLTGVFACEPMNNHLSCVTLGPLGQGSERGSHFLTPCLAPLYSAQSCCFAAPSQLPPFRGHMRCWTHRAIHLWLLFAAAGLQSYGKT